MVRYVCLSDLHAGGLTSMLRDLSGDPQSLRAKSKVTSAFAKAMGAFLAELRPASEARPQLILLGDVLDLQFSKRSDAVRDALGFLDALHRTEQLSGDVIATAGNHDHAIWAEARLTMEAAAVMRDDPDTRPITPAFKADKDAKCELLRAVLTKAGFSSLDLRYPNIGFANSARAVVLHHGHYVESEYRMMSSLKDALCDDRDEGMTVEKLAAENAAWVDFAWSPFDDADALEVLYQNFLTTAGFRRISQRWAKEAAQHLSEMLPLSGNRTVQDLLNVMTRTGMDAVLGRARDTERMAEVTSLTTSGMEGLKWYISQPVLGQIRHEKPEFEGDMTFVFGHTHRPFSMRTRVDGWDTPLKVHNTGGWTLNGPRLDNAEGASMVLIDAHLTTASLRLFSTPRNGKIPEVTVDMLSDGSAEEEAFRDRINAAINATQDHWDALHEVVLQAYLDRQALLLRLTGEDAAEAAE